MCLHENIVACIVVGHLCVERLDHRGHFELKGKGREKKGAGRVVVLDNLRARRVLGPWPKQGMPLTLATLLM